MRIDKLPKDLVFMWRSRLYSDVRIALTGNFSTTHENTTAIFSSHRFVLVCRSPYFDTALVSWLSNPKPLTEPLTLTLPSPPFTPASLHFTLAMTKLNPVIDAWAAMVREMILTGRRGIDETLCSKSEECFAHPDWLELMETDGVRFEDGERVEWIMASIRRGMNEKNAATVYQVLDYISICFPMSLSLFLCRPWFRLFYCDPTSQRAMGQCFCQHHIYGYKSSKFAWMFCGG
jgi:hypothetical protein